METKSILGTILTLSVLLLSAGCGGALGVASGPPESVLGPWQLAEGTVAGDPLTVPDGHRVTLTIEEDRLGGTAACNQYGGEHDIAGTSFAVRRLAQTDMGCEPSVLDAETRYLMALARADRIDLDGEELLISGPDVELRFAAVPPVDDQAIVGTRWLLDTLIEGETASSVQGDGYLLLHEDGTLEGSTGCRGLEGRWVTNGDEIDFPDFGATGECSDHLREQDDLVVSVLGDGFQAEVEGNRLTVTSVGSEGLGYHAPDE